VSRVRQDLRELHLHQRRRRPRARKLASRENELSPGVVRRKNHAAPQRRELMRAPRFRRARLADLDELLRLECVFLTDRLSRCSFRRLLNRSSAEIWVCEANGALMANAVLLYRR